jgi:hypothetical protein
MFKLNQPYVMILARESIGSRDDILTRADKGYDMGDISFVVVQFQTMDYSTI